MLTNNVGCRRSVANSNTRAEQEEGSRLANTGARRGRALHVNTAPADRLTQNWSDDDGCRGRVSRHNGLHKTCPGPSIRHRHVQGCRGLRHRRFFPLKVSSTPFHALQATIAIKLQNCQFWHYLAASVSVVSDERLPVEDCGECGF